MNEQALLASYNLAVQNGYKKSVDDFKQLLSTNSDALNASYNLALNNGYAKSLDDYKILVGVGDISSAAQQPIAQEVKKKDTVSPFVDGGLELTKFDPRTGQVVQEAPPFTQKQPDVTIPTQKQPEMAQFGYQPGKPLPEQIPSVRPDQPTQPKYTEEVMFGPMGISGVKTTGEAREFQGKSIPKVVGEIGKVLAKGAVKFPANVLETAAIATAAAIQLIIEIIAANCKQTNCQLAILL